MSDKYFNRDLFSSLSGKNDSGENIVDKVRKTVIPSSRFRISLDGVQLSVISIVMLILVLSAYCVGFERGRNRQGAESKVSSVPVMVEKPDAVLQENRTETVTVKPLKSQEEPVAKSSQDIEPIPENVEAVQEVKVYVIQVAAFKNISDAQKEVAKLGASGYNAFIDKRGGFNQVCIGQYESMDKAQKVLSGLKSMYKDCFIKNYMISR